MRILFPPGRQRFKYSNIVQYFNKSFPPTGRQRMPLLTLRPRYLPQREQDFPRVGQRGGPSPPYLHAEGRRSRRGVYNWEVMEIF